VLVGRNGQGKTNLVEAVGYLATMSSHRVSGDAPLVRHGAQQAVVRAALRRGDRELLVEVEINPGRANRVRVNRAPLQRPRELLGVVKTVLFAPEDLALVRGEPTDRRRFLDELLVSRTPRLAGVRADYDRVLKQRNTLLRTAKLARGDALATLDVWDTHLVDLGGQLLGARLGLVAELAPHVAAAYAQVAGPEAAPARLGYVSTVPLAGDGTPRETPVPDAAALSAALREQLVEKRREEVDRGVTLVGPHRDDLVVHLGPGPAKGYASHGESWSLALALKLACLALFRGDGEEPILVLDDVFAELDAGRRRALVEVAGAAEQTLITAAVDADVPPELAATRVRVADGTATVLDREEVGT
jgi:DNA replication and repair protein RecF